MDPAYLPVWWRGAALLLFPAVIARRLQTTPRQLGMAIGDYRFGLKAVMLLAPVFMLGTLAGSGNAGIQAFYPVVGDSVGASPGWLAAWWLIYLLYYISFEFFYRGFLLRGNQQAGMLWCIAVQAVFCFLIHIGKPAAELWASLPASIVFGWVAWRSHSIWYVVIIHYLVGVTNDLGALWQAGQLNLN